jgi:hypothetical protein
MIIEISWGILLLGRYTPEGRMGCIKNSLSLKGRGPG